MSNLEVEYRDHKFIFENTATAPALMKEIFNDNYKVLERGMLFDAGDVVLDIGANEGMFSIMLAKLFPQIRVISLEPVPRTFFQMIRNIALNKITNIESYCLGVSKDKRPGVMNVHKKFSGGSSLVDSFDPVNHELVNVELIPLDDFLTARWNMPSRIKLLKIDIEGGEYEALYAAAALLQRVDNVVAEFHINKRLERQLFDINELATWVGSRTNLLYYERCKMAE